MYTKFKGKQIAVKARTPVKSTLDATHNSRVKYFKDLKKSLPNKKRELNQKQRRFNLLERTPDLECNNSQIKEKNQLRSDIRDLQKCIDEIENNTEELDYYLKAGQILFEYYDNINKTPSKSINGVANSKKKAQAGNVVPSKSVVDFFTASKDSPKPKLKKVTICEATVHTFPTIENSLDNLLNSSVDPSPPAVSKAESVRRESSTSFKGSSSINELRGVNRTSPPKSEKASSPIQKPFTTWDNFVTKKEKFQRADLYEEFLSIIDPHYVRSQDGENTGDYFCEKCKEYRLFNQAEACMVCPNCGEYIPLIIDSDKPNYKDVPIEISYFAYKRMNHFNECLSQFQAKESTEIPQIVYDTILMEMKKERNTNLASLTKEKVKKYLKKHSNKNFNKYYEHIPHIINRLNGLPPKTMTPKMEEELRIMFRQIQAPFEKHCPKERKNFLNYNYVLHKFCQLKGWDDYLSCFPLLKSKDKLYQQDKIWRKICAELQWMYIPSR